MSAVPQPTFGLGPNQRRNTFDINQDDNLRGYGQMRHNPTRIYAPDQYGDAAGEHGRVWKIYRDRVGEIDDELLQGWNDALNTLLVFAGLFSAACTAFLIEVSKSLQPDWQRATSLAVFAIYVHLNSTSPPPFELPNPLLFSPRLDARWMNGLWFTSLTLSLVVSLLAILAKQWLNEFKSRMRKLASSPKAWALRHSLFQDGLERWGMDAMISVLPLLLHAALFLFLIGLCIMLLPLDDHVAGAVIGISGAVTMFYVAAGVAPVFWSDCPSATPALRYAFSLWNYVLVPAAVGTFDLLSNVLVLLPGHLIVSLFLLFGLRLPRSMLGNLVPSRNGRRSRMWIIPQYRRGTAEPKFDRAKIFAKDQPLREASVLTWMIRILPAQDDVATALCAACFLRDKTHFQQKEDNPLLRENVQTAAADTINGIITRNASDRIDDGTIANLLLACIMFPTRHPQFSDQVHSFLSEAAGRNTLQPEQLRVFKLAARGFQALPTPPAQLTRLGSSMIPQDACWEIARLAIIASDMSEPPFGTSAVSAFYSCVQRSLSISNFSAIQDPRLLFIATSDELLHRIEGHYSSTEALDSFIMSACSAAARALFSNHAAIHLPPDFQTQLRFVSTDRFAACDLPAADLSAIATLLLRTGRHIPPLALHHILYHFKRGRLPVNADELIWIRMTFQPAPVSSDLMDALRGWPCPDKALHISRLSLLQPVQLPISARRVTNYSSFWSVLLSIMPMPDTAEDVAKMACAYTVLLLALYRRGHTRPARDMLRELLPYERRVPIIARGTEARHHLALHAKIIDMSWWNELCQQLESDLTWSPCDKHPNSSSFITEIAAQHDCLECVPDEVASPLGLALPPTDIGRAAGDAPDDGAAETGDAQEDGAAVTEDAPEDGATVPQATAPHPPELAVPLDTPDRPELTIEDLLAWTSDARTWDAHEATLP